MEKRSVKSVEERQSEDFQGFNEVPVDDDEQVNLSDSFDDDLPVSDDDDDIQLSSPSNSLNSDVDQRWYAFRARNILFDNHIDVNQLDNLNQIPENNQPQQQQPQEEEETDFLEMDFEPDTNSEIENEATLPNDHPINNANTFSFHPSLPQPDFRLCNSPQLAQPLPDHNLNDFIRPVQRDTGAKPKTSSTIVRPQTKPTKQAFDGDNVFRISTNSNNILSSSSLGHSSNTYNGDEVYNLGASSSRETLHSERPHHDHYNHDHNGFLKIHKSPAKSSSHHSNKHQRLQEQNDQFLFETEPLKSRNTVTVYTTNCDEKILLDALVGLNENHLEMF